MIPKKIHYIWLGKGKKNKLTEICINSWYEKLPDYEIIEWNESNLDLKRLCSENRYIDQCYRRGLWAYLSDYLRLKILYDNGGIYLDTDVQVIKTFNSFLKNKMFIGMERGDHYGTGIIGCEKNNEIIHKILKFYDRDIWNEKIYTIPWIFRTVLKKNHSLMSGINIYPQDYFAPIDYISGYSRKDITPNTVTIHWFDGSWKRDLQVSLFLQTKHIKNPVLKKIVQAKKILSYYLKRE